MGLLLGINQLTWIKCFKYLEQHVQHPLAGGVAVATSSLRGEWHQHPPVFQKVKVNPGLFLVPHFTCNWSPKSCWLYIPKTLPSPPPSLHPQGHYFCWSFLLFSLRWTWLTSKPSAPPVLPPPQNSLHKCSRVTSLLNPLQCFSVEGHLLQCTIPVPLTSASILLVSFPALPRATPISSNMELLGDADTHRALLPPAFAQATLSCLIIYSLPSLLGKSWCFLPRSSFPLTYAVPCVCLTTLHCIYLFPWISLLLCYFLDEVWTWYWLRTLKSFCQVWILAPITSWPYNSGQVT